MSTWTCGKCGAPCWIEYRSGEPERFHHGEAEYECGQDAVVEWLEEVHRYEALPRQESRIR